MTTLRGVLATYAREMVEERERVTVIAVVDQARADHPDLFAAEEERLIVGAACRIVKDAFRELSRDEDNAQLTLPTIDFPSVIAVPAGGGEYEYVDSRKAKWPELVAGRDERERNVDAAQARLDRYNGTLRRLRPLMEPYPDRTVADAVALMTEPPAELPPTPTNAAREWTLTLPHARPPLTENQRLQWPVRHRIVRDLRAVTAELAEAAGIPALGRCDVTMHYAPGDARKRDEDNLIPTYKVICDGLVTAGVVSDDNPQLMVKHMPILEPVERPARLWVVVREIDPPSTVEGR